VVKAFRDLQRIQSVVDERANRVELGFAAVGERFIEKRRPVRRSRGDNGDRGGVQKENEQKRLTLQARDARRSGGSRDGLPILKTQMTPPQPQRVSLPYRARRSGADAPMFCAW